jgi:metal-sulfur cluster biosynthetic enzyme
MERFITNNPALFETAEKALRNVMDPEIQLNVVDLGLIYQIDFDEGAEKIYCSMTLTTRFCPMGSAIVGDVESALMQAFPGMKIETNLVFEPAWSKERISEEGRNFLNK